MARKILKKITKIVEDYTDPENIIKTVRTKIIIEEGGFEKSKTINVSNADLTKSIDAIIKTDLDKIKSDNSIN